MKFLLAALCCVGLLSCNHADHYDTIIRHGMIYDGTGAEPYLGDIGVRGDSIAFIGDLSKASAANEIEAKGMAVAPGFINMLSWANESLIADGRSMSDLKQGVTLEVMGEGGSMGPLNPAMRTRMTRDQSRVHYDVSWTTLGGYLNFLEQHGISCNVASFVGATTLREYVVGEDNRAPTAAELDSMRLLTREAMEEGAMGVGSSLIYPPAFFAKTDELVAICSEAAKYHGMYISHMRSEGNRLYEAVDELITIAGKAHIAAEIYHLKAAGKQNWNKLDSIIHRIEMARSQGLKITADMYTYTAGATGLTAAFPPSLQDGGFGMLWKRLHDPAIRKQMAAEMNSNPAEWENLYYSCGSPENVLLLGFRNDSLHQYVGKTLGQAAKMRGTSVEETAMDLIVADSSRIDVAYFLMSEENVKKQVALPWVSFGSDEYSAAPEGVFLKSSCHPRAYGNFIRVIGHYARDEKVLSLAAAIHKLSNLPADNLHLVKRGVLAVGNFADIVIFDPSKVKDMAVYEKPQQYAQGINWVLVNGIIVIKNGEHTGKTPGRFIKGPGYRQKSND